MIRPGCTRNRSRAPEFTASIDARYGEVRFQVTNLKSEPLEGLTFDDREPIRGLDQIEYRLRGKNASLANHLRKPIRLETKFHGANTYGLRADWQWLDAQGMYMLEDGKSIDHLLDLT